MNLIFSLQMFQEIANSAIVDLFHGDGDLARKYVRSSGVLLDTVGNRLPVSVGAIRENLHAVQRRNRLPLTDDFLDDDSRLAFNVEMETGTGKTFVYINTMYELHARYGLSKFVVVVPSIAIREGVQKFFEMTHEHFQARYDRPPIRWFVYNSARLGDVREFAQSSGIEVMIINIDAFRKAENVIHQYLDRMHGGRAIDLIRDVRPVVIIDEPQSVDNTPKAKEALSWLSPLFTLRYSATHREKVNTVYRLTPVDAYQQGLVKQISVSSIAVLDGFNRPYVRLVGVSADHGFKARVELDAKSPAGKLSRVIKTLSVGADLFLASGERELYRDWRLTDIDATPGAERIELSGAHTLPLGQAMGDVAEEDIKRGQIRRTVEIHLDKELRLLPLGVKVLSLFFIDQVDRYRRYEDGEAQKGEYARLFEEEYAKRIADPKYAPLLAALPQARDVAAVHDGYFSVDKKGRVKDTRGDTADDQDTYALIMRDKERLLSFETPLRFIFSHSALREGWDNPNVFQVCTLLDRSSALSARQKIGRGLRLCVNQHGERVHDKNINILHVIAQEHFAEFADNLQREIEQDTGVKFGTLDIATFIDIDIPVEAAAALGIELPPPDEASLSGEISPEEAAAESPLAGSPETVASINREMSPADMSAPVYNEPALPSFAPPPATVKLGHEGARQLLDNLAQQGVIDKKGKITAKGREELAQGALQLPAPYQPIANPIIAQIHEANRKIEIRDAAREIVVRRKKQVFVTPEFQAIWERIRQKTLYRVKMHRERFIDHAAAELRRILPKLQPMRVVETNADVDMKTSGVTAEEKHTRVVATLHDAAPMPDLLTVLRGELNLRKQTLREILVRSGRLGDYIVNPERFLEDVVTILRDAKAAMIVDGIRYLKLAGEEYSVQEVFDKDELVAYLDHNAVPVQHSVYDHVVVDSPGVEGRFAKALDADPDVKLFFKLPPNFKVDTPLGAYNPDWAVLIEMNGNQCLYFVLETKGGAREADRRLQETIKIRCAQQHFAALGDIAYDTANDWHAAKTSLIIP